MSNKIVSSAGSHLVSESDVDRGTAASEISPPPVVSVTHATVSVLTEDVGYTRSQVRDLNEKAEDLHQQTYFVEWRLRSNDRGKAAVGEMLAELADYGFAWRDIARLVGVSVPALQKWRRGQRATGESRLKVASLLAACDLIVEHYEVQEIGSWFEMPLAASAPITPIDMYAAERPDLVFEHASSHVDPEQVLTLFDPEWRERYRSDFEVVRAGDGELSIRPKAR